VPGTVWGTASRQNWPVMVGAVLARNSGRLPIGCRGPACLDYPPRRRRQDRIACDRLARGITCRRAAPVQGAFTSQPCFVRIAPARHNR
jgi:hypothetical protein